MRAKRGQSKRIQLTFRKILRSTSNFTLHDPLAPAAAVILIFRLTLSERGFTLIWLYGRVRQMGRASSMKRFLCGLVVPGTLGILLCWGAVAEADFTIMPLGDSITYGFPVPGGYRNRLYSDLRNAGYSFSFVGTSTDNPSSLLT